MYQSTKVSKYQSIKVPKTHLVTSQKIVEMSDDDVNQDSDIVVIEQFRGLFLSEDLKEQFVDSVGSVDVESHVGEDGGIFFPVEMRDKVLSELTRIGSERECLDDETVLVIVEVESEREDRWETGLDRDDSVHLVPCHITPFHDLDEFKEELLIDMFIQSDGRLVTSAEDDCEQTARLTPSLTVSWIVCHLIS